MKRLYRIFVTSFALLSLISIGIQRSKRADHWDRRPGWIAHSAVELRRFPGTGPPSLGYSNASDGQEAIKWTEAGGLMGLGDIPGRPLPQSEYVSFSRRFCHRRNGERAEQREYEATRWTSAGLTRLGSLITRWISAARTVFRTMARSSLVRHKGNAGFEAMYWNATDGMVGIGDLRGPGTRH